MAAIKFVGAISIALLALYIQVEIQKTYAIHHGIRDSTTGYIICDFASVRFEQNAFIDLVHRVKSNMADTLFGHKINWALLLLCGDISGLLIAVRAPKEQGLDAAYARAHITKPTRSSRQTKHHTFNQMNYRSQSTSGTHSQKSYSYQAGLTNLSAIFLKCCKHLSPTPRPIILIWWVAIKANM